MMAILPFAPLHAQVYKVDNFPGTGQIMRLVADSSERVIYTERAQGVCSFVFVIDSTVMSFDLPSGMHVNDFELDGWNAYFCGSYGSHGLVGTFNVKEVFFAGDSVSYVWCNSNTTYTNYTIHVSDFTKLDINRTATGISLALIGDAVIDPQYNLNRTVPTSVEFTPGGWKFTYFYNKDGTIHYTDIACLDNVVTAVGYLEASPDMCVVRSFRQVGNFPAYFLGDTPCYDGTQAQLQSSAPAYKAVMSNPDAPYVRYNPQETAVNIVEHVSFEVCP